MAPPSASPAVNPPRRKWRLKRWIALAALLLVVAVISGWLLFQHIPGWYRPVIVAPGEVDRIKHDIETQQTWFSEGLHGSEVFQFVLRPEQINRWLARIEYGDAQPQPASDQDSATRPKNILAAMWPLSREWFPPEVSDPCVTFEEGGMRIGATYHSGDTATVVSVRLLVDGRVDGIWVTLDSVQLGSLPLPKATIREALGRVDRSIWPAGRAIKYQNLNEPLPPLTALLDEARLPNSFLWWNPRDQPFRIVSLKIHSDQMVATIERLPMSARQRH